MRYAEPCDSKADERRPARSIWTDALVGTPHAFAGTSMDARQLALWKRWVADPTRSHFDAQDYMDRTPGLKATHDGW